MLRSPLIWGAEFDRPEGVFSLKPEASWKHNVSFASTRLFMCRKDSVFLFCKCMLCLLPCLILLGFSYCLLYFLDFTCCIFKTHCGVLPKIVFCVTWLLICLFVVFLNHGNTYFYVDKSTDYFLYYFCIGIMLRKYAAVSQLAHALSFFGLFFGRVMWPLGYWFPNQRLILCPLQRKHRVLTTGPQREEPLFSL